MDEPTPSAPPAPPAPVKTGLRIDRIYLRDVSFESPQAPGVFASEWKPQFTIELNTRANRLDDARFEVILMVNLEAKSDENTLFMVELQQAGIFHIEAANEEELREVLGVACPESLFPYAREAVDNLLAKGTFPAVHARAGELRHPVRRGEEAPRGGAGHRLTGRRRRPGGETVARHADAPTCAMGRTASRALFRTWGKTRAYAERVPMCMNPGSRRRTGR